jgi:DNA-binding transcriptional MerR regulator
MPAQPRGSNGYSVGELAALADVTPRTVRYYVAQGLLPAPASAGPASRYGKGHADRLRLIRRLQRRHLPLVEIRHRLVDMTEADVAAALREPEGVGSDGRGSSALDYVRALLEERATYRPEPPPGFVARASAEPAAPRPGGPPALMSADRAMAGRARRAPVPPPPIRGTSAAAQRSQWERIGLGPDVELHVRRPLSRHQNRQVDRLVAIARDLLEEDQL